MKLEFVQTDRFIYTNLGRDPKLAEQLTQAGVPEYLQAETIIRLDHRRGQGELVHRALKEFATKEQLPFERMGMNRAYYYFLLLSHFLYETYKRDIGEEIIPMACYPNTFRRRLIGFAVKIVVTGRKFILKATAGVFEQLHLTTLTKFSFKNLSRRGETAPLTVLLSFSVHLHFQCSLNRSV
jgi:hypothetical protein